MLDEYTSCTPLFAVILILFSNPKLTREGSTAKRTYITSSVPESVSK